MTEERKRAALQLLREAYRESEAFLRSLDAKQLERPVFTGEGSGWRVRDLIAHFAAWQTLAARAAEKMAKGEALPEGVGLRQSLGIGGTLDEFNQGGFREWRARDVEAAFAELRVANQRLIAALEALPPERIITGEGPEDFLGWQPGVNHFRQHREHIDTALREATAT